jgi:limonene-1,2-epoxide hydrolase
MSGATPASGEPSPGEVVRSFIRAWNANDMTAVVAHLHQDVLYHNVPVEPIRGREGVRAYLASKGGFDWVDWKLLALAETGSRVLTERLDEFGIGGRDISLPVMGIFEVEDGLIRLWRDYFDLGTYRRQLGALPGPGGA